MTGQVIPFNPLDKKNLGSNVAAALMAQPSKRMAELRSFHGAGIYALYYTGKFKPYAAMSLRNRGVEPEIPIYVEKQFLWERARALPCQTPQKARRCSTGSANTQIRLQ